MKLKLFDIIAYLDSRHVQYWTEGENVTPGWVNIQCLFCSDSFNHLGINLHTKYYSCWKCGAHGPTTKIVRKIDQLPSLAMADSIMEDFILDPSMMPKENKRQASGALVEIETFPFSTSPPSLKKFIKKRGITDEMLNKYALGYTTYHSEMGYRIIFGITYKGILVTYVGRDFLEKQELKYKNYPLEMSAMDPKELLFGYDDIRENQSIIIVEGIIDQMKLGIGAVATLGTSFKDEQIQRLYEKKPKKIFTLYDSEPEAQRRAEKLCSKIWFCPCEIVELTEANDPGELTLKQAEEVKHLLLGGVK